MSDEHLTNEEETSALFVSAQKKRKAEEEAAQKAAEEQAKRDAAEAEVRRMEAEVEERKRKAEEEKKALEEEEKRLAEEKASGAQEKKPEPPKAPEKKAESAGGAAPAIPKRTLIIAIAAVAAVAVILIAVFALKGKGGKKSFDPATTEFSATYASQEAGFGLSFAYPDSVYKEVTEEKKDENEMTIHFGTRKGIDVGLETFRMQDGSNITRTYASALIPADDMMTELKKQSSDKLKELIPDVKISEEKATDVTADDAGMYSWKCTFESAAEGTGAASAWFDSNSDGVVKIVTAVVKTGATADEAAAIRDAFTDKNSGNALGVPGYKPPTGTDTDGKLEVDEIHMGLLVPKDQFTRYTEGDLEYYLFTDDNGASILVDPVDAGGDILETMSIEGIEELFKKWVDRGVNDYFKACDSRMILDENFVAEETGINYTANCKDIIGGVTYWERYIAAYWYDERQQKDFYYIMITMAPERNKSTYQPVYDKMIDRLQDL